jgi:hypothetical protein
MIIIKEKKNTFKICHIIWDTTEATVSEEEEEKEEVKNSSIIIITSIIISTIT